MYYIYVYKPYTCVYLYVHRVITSATKDGGYVFTPFCLSVFLYRISQKVVDKFGRNLLDRLGVSEGQIDSILVTIQIRIRMREFINFLSDSSPVRVRAETI